MSCLREGKDGTLSLAVYVQPNASLEGVAGMHDGAVKLCITAPAVQDKANLAATRFLAHLFSLPKSAVLLERGSRNRMKIFHLRGLSLDDARAILSRYLAEPAGTRS